MDLGDVFEFRKDDLHSFSDIMDMREKEILCDVTIKAGTVLFNAHRLILASAIPYFRGMFTSNMKECTQHQIEMKDIDPEALKCLLNFVYTRHILISVQSVGSLLDTSMILQFDCVTEECLRFLVGRINSMHAHALRDDGFPNETLNINAYLLAAGQHPNASMPKMIFFDLSFSAIREIIGRNDLDMGSEENVFQFVMDWVKISEVDRAIHLPELLRQVRMTLIDQEYLLSRVSTEELIRTSLPCRDLVEKAKYYHMLKNKGTAASFTFNAQEIRGSDKHHQQCAKVMGFGVYSASLSGNTTLFVHYYDSFNQTWMDLCSQNQPGEIIHYFCREGKIYFVSEEFLHVLDLVTLEWTSKKVTVDVPRAAGVTWHRNKVYFCGGSDRSDRFSKRLLCLELETATWSPEGEITKGREFPCAVSVGDHIFVVGGYAQYSSSMSVRMHLRTVEKYSSVTRECTEVPPMPTARNSYSCAALNGEIYVCGGILGRYAEEHSAPTNTCEVYHTVTNEWRLITKMNRAMRQVCLFPCADELYAIDGGVMKDDDFHVESYDRKEKKWKCGGTLTRARGRQIPSVVTFPGKSIRVIRLEF